MLRLCAVKCYNDLGIGKDREGRNCGLPVLSQHLLGDTEENHEKSPSG
jgi:hypothetical protein